MRDPFNMSSTLLTTETQQQQISRELALTIAQAADDRKGADIQILGVAEVSYLTDYFVIVTGFSRVQVRAISQSIKQQVEEVWQRLPLRTEGQSDGSWILQDYGEVIVHIMLPQEREFYNLEAFWGHAEQIEFQPQQPQQ
ncbi:ribosome silencing factor [Coleofasciculus sp. LEGE 07092]|nr:ribosome silencing factor [Coleofasciculus sp. LEGE 07081]MBE9150096.1 ribosome silencing factor [Coleofasciculus sp. LEGE 07092]